MYIFRIHIRPQGGSADMKTTFEYCLKNKLLGVGWRTESERNTKNWDEYFIEAEKIHDNLNVCKYIKTWVSMGDLVWTRSHDGQYYIARVLSGWEYWTSEEAKKKDIDIANVFRCEIKKVEIDDVPGKVVACFRGSRSIQEIADERAAEYSKYLWNSLAKKEVYKIETSKYADIFTMFDDEETEDIIFLFMQSKGWYVLPNSRKKDTMSFEYYAVNPKTYEKAVAQVKTGNSIIDLDEYSQLPYKVFLFQSKELFQGKMSDNIICVQRKDIIKFINNSVGWLPKSLKRKVELASICAK